MTLSNIIMTHIVLKNPKKKKILQVVKLQMI
jgi:hypothetical protein